MKFIYLFIIIITIQLKADFNNVNLYNEFNTLYFQGKYKKALLKAESYLKIVDDNPNIGDLADLYIRVSEKLNINPTIFLLKIVENKKDYITKERIILAIANYHLKKEEYYSAIKYYRWIERNHNSKSLVYDDSLWNSFQIYKKIQAYNKAIEYLDKIISTHQYSIYVGTYNQFHLYDAYIEKANLLIKQKKKGKAISTLKFFIENFNENDKVDDAYYELCKIHNKNYCCKLIKKRPLSSHFNSSKRICDELNN
jgi:tetratricopeptide (TPR) repeat protein